MTEPNLHLAPLDSDIWDIEAPLVVGGMHIGTRTVLIRLTDGKLWVHSPGPLSESLIQEVRALGDVGVLIAPSRIHFFYLQDWMKAFPEADVHVAPGFAKKLHKKMDCSQMTELTDAPPDRWKDVIDQVFVAGIPYVNEVVFLHRPSGTLILTDLAFNLGRPKHLITRWLMTVNGVIDKFTPSRLIRRLIRDKGALRSSLRKIEPWDFQRITVCHGANVTANAKERFRSAFANYL